MGLKEKSSVTIKGFSSSEALYVATPFIGLTTGATAGSDNNSAVGPQGQDPVAGNYFWGTTNKGSFVYDGILNEINLIRPSASFIDLNYFPPDSRLVHKLKNIRKIKTRLKITSGIGTGASEVACGIIFGFGETTPVHGNSGNMLLNLRLDNRNWPGHASTNVSAGMDFVRMGYQVNMLFAPKREFLKTDMPMNSYNQGTGSNYTFWNRTRFSNQTGNFVVQDNSLTTTRIDNIGEWIETDYTIEHNPTLHTITFTMTPIATSEIMTTWNTATGVWHYDNPPGSTFNGDEQEGIDFAPTLTTWDQLLEKEVMIGFSAVGQMSDCRYRNMEVTYTTN
jgi:hypothetical protein